MEGVFKFKNIIFEINFINMNENKTKTEMEMQDTSWKQIKGGVMLLGIILIGVYAYNNFIKK
jgi:hypothetical protein